jgi:hypothetical protein
VGKGLIDDVPEGVDGQFAVIVVVLKFIKVHALPEAMDAEDDADASEEVIVGNIGDEDEDGEDDDGAAGVCPTEHITHLLKCVYYHIDHSQHQLNYLLYLE